MWMFSGAWQIGPHGGGYSHRGVMLLESAHYAGPNCIANIGINRRQLTVASGAPPISHKINQISGLALPQSASTSATHRAALGTQYFANPARGSSGRARPYHES